MITVEVHSIDLQTINYKNKKGEPAQMFKQEAYVHLIDRQGKKKPYPEKTTISVPVNASGHPVPYAPGQYLLHPSSFYLDRFGGLSVAPVLSPAKSTS